MRRGVRKAPGGFTIIELLFVILIIFLLMGLLIGGIKYVSSRAKGAADLAAVKTLGQSANLFKQQFESNGSTVDGSIAIEDYGDTTADQAGLVGGRLTVTTSDGQEVPLTVAVVTLRTGDVATALMATGVGPSIDSVDISGVATRIEELQADA